MFYYTGIGSRETPENILNLITKLAKYIDKTEKFTLRTGGARGADTAFEKGVSSNRINVYYPNIKHLYKNRDKAIIAAKQVWYSPYGITWDKLKPFTQELMIRNSYQIFGETFNRKAISKFVICYTKSLNKDELGGTGQAIRLAEKFNIPVFNLGNDSLNLKDLKEFIDNLASQGE